MGILKWIFKPPKPPEFAPCEHELTTFLTLDRRHVTILVAGVRKPSSVFSDLPAKLWCSECGFVTITDEQYTYYKDRNGNKAA